MELEMILKTTKLLLCTYFTPARIQHNGVFLNSHSYFYAAGFSQDIPNIPIHMKT